MVSAMSVKDVKAVSLSGHGPGTNTTPTALSGEEGKKETKRRRNQLSCAGAFICCKFVYIHFVSIFFVLIRMSAAESMCLISSSACAGLLTGPLLSIATVCSFSHITYDMASDISYSDAIESFLASRVGREDVQVCQT